MWRRLLQAVDVLILIGVLGSCVYATFPTIAGTKNSETTTAGTSHTVNYDVTPTSGDLLITTFEVSSTGVTITWPAGWTQINTNSSLNNQSEIRYKVAGASEGTSFSITTDSSVTAVARVYRVGTGTYTGNPEASGANGSSANPNSPALTPSWGSADVQWIAIATQIGQRTFSSFPTSYINTGQHDSGKKGDTQAYGDRQLTGSTENPSAFGTGQSASWVAQTIGVQGTGGAATPKGLLLKGVGFALFNYFWWWR